MFENEYKEQNGNSNRNYYDIWEEAYMLIKGIVYTSKAGHTKKYAEILGKKLNLPVYELSVAFKKLQKGSEIIYLGWLMAGKVKGLKKASKHFDIKAICGVGMSSGDSQLVDMSKANQISGSATVFYLQGGFEIEKLHGIYKLMMKVMKSTLGKGLADKQNRTQEEDDMLNLMIHGGDMVKENNLMQIVDWFNEQ